MISHEELQEAANYDAKTGLFTWRQPLSNKYVPGDPMGAVNNRGYLNLWIRGHRGLAHRFAWLYVHGEMPDGQIDHINGDRLDNRIINLRVVSNQENSKNQKLCRSSKTGIPGVRFRRDCDRWDATITSDKRHHLGMFSTLLDASAARKSAELKHGFHKNHGRHMTSIPELTNRIDELERIMAAKDAEIARLRESMMFACESLAIITSSDGSGHADISVAALRLAGIQPVDREKLVDGWKANRAWSAQPARQVGGDGSLMPCPFCGCPATILTDAENVRITGSHSAACPFRDVDVIVDSRDAWQARAALAPAAVVKDSRYFRISGSGGVRYIRKSPNLALLMPGDTMEEFHFEDQLPKLIGIPSFNQEDES